jgi:glycyl-tRNA synthetase beta subunit
MMITLLCMLQGAKKVQEALFCHAAQTGSTVLQGTEYCYVTVQAGGRSAADLLAEELPKLLKCLTFSKTMRWHPHSDHAFSRPLRWLVALHGATVVPFVAGGVSSGRTVQLMRGAEPREAILRAAEDYAGVMERAGIVGDVATRRELIWHDVVAAAEVRLVACCV